MYLYQLVLKCIASIYINLTYSITVSIDVNIVHSWWIGKNHISHLAPTTPSGRYRSANSAVRRDQLGCAAMQHRIWRTTTFPGEVIHHLDLFVG